MTLEAKIYTLSDKNGGVFWVGCTIREIEQRLYDHLCEARNNHPYSNKRKNEKIRGLNYDVYATVIDTRVIECQSRSLAKRETKNWELEWIYKYRNQGYELCNSEVNRKLSYLREIAKQNVWSL